MRLPPGAPKPTFVDRPDLTETFADTLETFFTDGETLRMEFCVDRVDARSVKPGKQPPKITQHPVARIVIPMSTAVEMVNKLNNLFANMAAEKSAKVLPGIPRGPAN